MTTFTFDDFINAANGQNTNSESLGQFFKEPDEEPEILCGAYYGELLKDITGGAVDLCDVEDHITDIYNYGSQQLKNQYIQEKNRLKDSILDILETTFSKKSEASDEEPIPFDDSEKLKLIVDEIKGTNFLMFLYNFYVILKDENIKHQVIAYTVKRITKEGFSLPESFTEAFTGTIKDGLLNTGKCLK